MNYFIFDNPSDKKNMEFLNEYNIDLVQLYPNDQCLSIKSMIKFCNDCITSSSTNDTLICWYDFMGILTWWLCKIRFKKRKIVVLNLLLKDKISLKNKIAKILYSIALNSKNIRATVTSTEYGNEMKNILQVKQNFTLLHDIFHTDYKVDQKIEIKNNSVFCGGRNGRNWEFIVKLSELMDDVTFNLVMPKNVFDKYSVRFGANVNAKFDISFDEYSRELLKSTIVVTPLETEAPAGLIAFFQAAANNKMIITSDTVTTREYFSEGRGVLLNDNLYDWKKAIYYFLNNEDERSCCSEKLYDFLNKECSEENYVNVLKGLL